MTSRWPLLACTLSLCGIFTNSGPARAQDPGVEAEDLTEDPAAAAAQEAEAARAYSEGDLPRAVAIYRELAAGQSDAAERTRLHVTAAWLIFESGDRASAAQELSQALFAQPDYRPRADLYSADFLALVEDARAGAARDRAASAAQKLKDGLAAAKAGDATNARQLLEGSLELVPQQPRAIHAIAALDLAAGRSDDALAGFQKVVALKHGSPGLVPSELEAQALNNIGVIYLERQQPQDAAEALERAAGLAPSDARAWFNLALARLALGRKIDGSQALERAHRLDRGDAEISLRLGRVYREAGSYVESVALLLDATAAHPQSAALFFELAQAQRGIGNRSGALASLGKAIDLDPENSTGVGFAATLMRGEEQLAAADTPAAARDAERATAMAPGDAAAWALLGLSRKAEGRLPEAAQSLEKASTLAPQRVDIAHNLGTVYLSQRRYPEAERAFRRALEIDPNFAESRAALARLEGARGSLPPAAAASAKSGPAGRPATAQPRELGASLRAVDYQPLGIRGLLVEQVAPGSVAERAGLLIDDLILRADGRPMTQVPSMTALVRSSSAASIALSLLRAGRPVELRLQLR
jgi:tetratricopeptide (TPR) repeat protein